MELITLTWSAHTWERDGDNHAVKAVAERKTKDHTKTTAFVYTKQKLQSEQPLAQITYFSN